MSQTTAYVFDILVVDHDNAGRESIAALLESNRYINPRVLGGVTGIPLGEWTDDHPLNFSIQAAHGWLCDQGVLLRGGAPGAPRTAPPTVTIEIEHATGEPIDLPVVRAALAQLGIKTKRSLPGSHLLAKIQLDRAVAAVQLAVDLTSPDEYDECPKCGAERPDDYADDVRACASCGAL